MHRLEPPHASKPAVNCRGQDSIRQQMCPADADSKNRLPEASKWWDPVQHEPGRSLDAKIRHYRDSSLPDKAHSALASACVIEKTHNSIGSDTTLDVCALWPV